MKENDQELIILCRLGDNSAFDKMYLRYKQLIISIVRKYYLVGADQEDLMQEGMIGLFKAINGYDVSKEIAFGAYAKPVIERQIFTTIKKANAKKYNALNEREVLDHQGSIVKDDSISILPSDALSPEENILQDEEYEMLMNKIRPELSEFENEVFRLYMVGYAYGSIATELNVSNKKVDNALTRIKSKIKSLIVDKE